MISSNSFIKLKSTNFEEVTLFVLYVSNEEKNWIRRFKVRETVFL